MLQLSSHHIRTILTVRPEEAQNAYHQAVTAATPQGEETWDEMLEPDEVPYFREPRLIHSIFPYIEKC